MGCGSPGSTGRPLGAVLRGCGSPGSTGPDQLGDSAGSPLEPMAQNPRSCEEDIRREAWGSARARAPPLEPLWAHCAPGARHVVPLSRNGKSGTLRGVLWRFHGLAPFRASAGRANLPERKKERRTRENHTAPHPVNPCPESNSANHNRPDPLP